MRRNNYQSARCNAQLNDDGILCFADNSFYPIDTFTANFLLWLKTAKSFAYNHSSGRVFTIRKEKNGYWYIYKTINWSQNKRYIGNDKAVTVDNLEKLATDIIANPTKHSGSLRSDKKDAELIARLNSLEERIIAFELMLGKFFLAVDGQPYQGHDGEN